MTDRPIIFSSAMVRALIDGRKTQTRRVLKPQPDTSKISPPFHPESRGGRRWVFMARDDFPTYSFATCDFRVPYAVGDRLYVRESFQGPHAYELHGYKPKDWGNKPIWYCADGEMPAEHKNFWSTKVRPPRHMPRFLSRLTLIVTDVRVQRVQDISDGDAFAEGISTDAPIAGQEIDIAGQWWAGAPKARYRKLWDSLNAARGFGWDANPWVCAVTFTAHRQNIDQVSHA